MKTFTTLYRSTGSRATHSALGILFILLVAAVVVGCSGDSGDTFRVAVIRYQHETCTFCPGGDTEIEDWTRYRGPLVGDEVLEAGGYIGGFVNMAEEYGDIELLGITSPYEVYGGSSRSWNSEASFEHFMGLILDDLRSKLPVDGVHLALHGAMAVRNVPRPEAEIARRVRELVGPDVPIVGTFDPHGNEDGEFLRWADGAFVVKRFPHYDAFLQGERAARYMREMMKGRYTPTTASRKPPIITATVLQWTGASPPMDIMERARRWEAREPGAYVSVFFGYPWSDVPDVGTCVHVMTNDDQARRRRERVHLARPRGVRTRRVPAAGRSSAQGAAGHRRRRDAGRARRLLGPAGGRHLDPAPAHRSGCERRALRRAPRRARPRGAGRARRPARRSVLFESEGSEQVAAIEYGEGNMLVLAPTYTQITSPNYLRFGPVDPDAYDVFVLKSRAHFRRGFDETGYAKTIIIVDAPGPWIGTTRLDALDYQFAPIERLYPFGTPDEIPGG